MKITLSKADMTRGTAQTPGWYTVECLGMELKTPKNPKPGTETINYVLSIRIPKLDGFEMSHTFNSAAVSNMVPFIAAIRNVPVAQIRQQQELDFDTDEVAGAKIQVKLINDTWDGRLVNKLEDFLPAGASVPF